MKFAWSTLVMLVVIYYIILFCTSSIILSGRSLDVRTIVVDKISMNNDLVYGIENVSAIKPKNATCISLEQPEWLKSIVLPLAIAPMILGVIGMGFYYSKKDALTKRSREKIDLLINRISKKLPDALTELKKQRKKSGHWAWWAFPTEREGQNEVNYANDGNDKKTSIEDPIELEYFSKNVDNVFWDLHKQIIELCNKNITDDCIQKTFQNSSDHKRIHAFYNLFYTKLKEKVGDFTVNLNFL